MPAHYLRKRSRVTTPEHADAVPDTEHPKTSRLSKRSRQRARIPELTERTDFEFEWGENEDPPAPDAEALNTSRSGAQILTTGVTSQSATEPTNGINLSNVDKAILAQARKNIKLRRTLDDAGMQRLKTRNVKVALPETTDTDYADLEQALQTSFNSFLERGRILKRRNGPPRSISKPQGSGKKGIITVENFLDALGIQYQEYCAILVCYLYLFVDTKTANRRQSTVRECYIRAQLLSQASNSWKHNDSG